MVRLNSDHYTIRTAKSKSLWWSNDNSIPKFNRESNNLSYNTTTIRRTSDTNSVVPSNKKLQTASSVLSRIRERRTTWLQRANLSKIACTSWDSCSLRSRARNSMSGRCLSRPWLSVHKQSGGWRKTSFNLSRRRYTSTDDWDYKQTWRMNSPLKRIGVLSWPSNVMLWWRIYNKPRSRSASTRTDFRRHLSVP